MSGPQQETVESPPPSITGTVSGDQRQRIVDEEKDLFGKEVVGYESAVAADEIEDQLDVHPDGGLRAWLVCMGVNNFGSITVVSPPHLRHNSAQQASAQRLVLSTRGV